MVCFAKLPAVKKDTILAAARNFFGYSYFVTALFKSVSNIETCNYRLLSTSRKELWKFVIFCYLSIRTKFAQKFFERLLDFSQKLVISEKWMGKFKFSLLLPVSAK